MNESKLFLDTIRADNKFDKFKDSFIKLKTDQERIIFIFKNMLQCNYLFFHTVNVKKDTETSVKLIQQGYEYFIKSDNRNSTLIYILKLFTMGIAFAPYSSMQLVNGYTMRAQILPLLGLYSECIKDVDRALKLKYVDNDATALLYLRKIECLITLRKFSLVEKTIKEAQDWLNKRLFNNSNNKLYFDSKLDTLRSKAMQAKQSVIDDNSTRTKMKKSENKLNILSRNAEAPCASNAVAIKYDKDYGRHIIATRNIKPGEIIAVEKPYTLLLSQHNVATHCSNCLEVCWANIPCKHCTYAMYCSKKCRDDEWKKCHNVECNVFSALIAHYFTDLELLSVRLAVFALKEADGNMEKLRTMTKKFDQCDDPRISCFFDGKLQSDKYIGVYNLVTNTEKRKFENLFTMSWNTCLILFYLATRTKIFGIELPIMLHVLTKIDDVTFFGGLILRHRQILSCNCYNLNEVQGLQYLQRSVAITPFCSLINHSCNPNVIKQSISERILIRTLQPIKKGDQLFGSYCSSYVSDKIDNRQKQLKQQFFFDCNCIACLKKWPLCQLYTYKTFVRKLKDRAKIKKTLQNLDTYEKLVKSDNVCDKPYIKEKLLRMVEILHNYNAMPCKEMDKVLIALRNTYMLDGNRFDLPQIPTRQE